MRFQGHRKEVVCLNRVSVRAKQHISPYLKPIYNTRKVDNANYETTMSLCSCFKTNTVRNSTRTVTTRVYYYSFLCMFNTSVCMNYYSSRLKHSTAYVNIADAVSKVNIAQPSCLFIRPGQLIKQHTVRN